MLHEQAIRLASLTPATASPRDFNGRWRNQMASFMDVAVNGSSVTGTYNSASSSSGGSVQGAISGVTEHAKNVDDAARKAAATLAQRLDRHFGKGGRHSHDPLPDKAS